jgi:NADPH-dependent 2,4-dienoyl-CoA reductase/sulfur reductase-like enzyme
MKAVIIGGDAAGMSAATKLKRIAGGSKVFVYEKGDYLSYAACGLPYYAVDDDIKKESLIQMTKSKFESLGIYPILFHEVVKVFPDEKRLIVRNTVTGATSEDDYDKLLIATGARPIVPDVPGVDLDMVRHLKTVGDGEALKKILTGGSVKDVTIIGGGYIGVEAADNLISAGLRVRIIQRPDRLLRNFEPEFSEYARAELKRLGVVIKTGEALLSIEGDGKAEKVVTDKSAYDTDLVLLAIGVRPATEFLKDTGISLASNGAVIIDRQMRTNIDDIYAAGDCAEVYHMLKGSNAYLPLATNANKCGRIVGENLSGRHVEFAGALGSAAVKVGDIEIARTGLSESEAKSMGIDCKTVMVEAEDLPAYYPGSSPMHIKVIYEAGTRRLLGAQAAGKKGAVLRMDVFACAIAGSMTAGDLGMLDLCYAPPFATPWDAVNIAANAAK